MRERSERRVRESGGEGEEKRGGKGKKGLGGNRVEKCVREVRKRTEAREEPR